MFWGYESFYIHGLENRLEEVRDPLGFSTVS